MKHFLLILLLSALTVGAPIQSLADETTDLLNEAIDLLRAGDNAEAREVVAIALDQIDHLLMDATAAVFPMKIGMFTRGEVQSQKAMGIDITECTYTDEKGQEFDVQLMGGGGGIFGNIADMGATMGGGRKERIAGRTGSSTENDGETTISLKLKNGKNLMFTSYDLNREDLKKAVVSFPVDEIDK